MTKWNLRLSGDSDGKASACNVGDLGSIPGSRRSSGEGNGNPLQYSFWEIPWREEPGGIWSMGLKVKKFKSVNCSVMSDSL